MIVNIRGTSGSGKTWLVRRLLEATAARPARWRSRAGVAVPALFEDETATGDRPLVYWGSGMPGVGPTYVLGSYVNECGGCDTIKSQDEVCDLVREYAPQGHVVFEGLLMVGTFARFNALALELAPVPFVFAWLTTPLEVCLERVRVRRDARGRAKGPLDPTNTTDRIKAMASCREKLEAAGRRNVDLPWEAPLPTLLALLRE